MPWGSLILSHLAFACFIKKLMNHCRESHVFHNKAEMMCKCAKGNPQKLNVKTKNNLKSNDFSPTSTFHSDDVLGPFLKIYLGPLNYNIHP